MKKDIIINDEFIVKYLAGETIPEEAIAMHEWLIDFENQLYFEKIQTVWHATNPSKKPRNINRQDAWDVIKDLVTETVSVTTSPRIPSFKRNRFVFKIAASVLVVLSLSFLAYLKTHNQNPSEIIVSSSDTIMNVKLPDNSNIVLYRYSNLTYAANFGQKARDVHFISGEAFFTVAKNKAMPFVIYTKLATIKVLGTSFNVDLTKDQLNVSVNEGKVLLYTNGDSIYLEAGYSGTVLAGKTSIIVNPFVDINTWGYATHKFVFKNSPFKEVLDCLGKAYSYSFDLQNKNIGKCKLTATFDNVSVEYILALLSESLNLSVTKNDHLFILDGEGCP